jgi:ferritin
MKESNVGEFVIKKLDNKIVTKRVLNSYDFYELCFKMGVWEDDEIMEKIISYLDDNNIDINFNAVDKVFFDRYRHIECKIKMGKKIKDRGESIKELIRVVNGVKVNVRPQWLDTYRNEEETQPEGVIKNNLDFMSEIIEKYKNDIKDTIENQPTPNILDILKEIE